MFKFLKELFGGDPNTFIDPSNMEGIKAAEDLMKLRKKYEKENKEKKKKGNDNNKGNGKKKK